MRWFTLLLIGCISVQAAGAVINVPADHATIQAAIVAANPGDVVIVAAGTYPESINFFGKAITVRSTDPTDPVVVMQTIIDGTGFLHVVKCVSGEGPDTVLSGFVITGGNANGLSFPDNGGGGMLIQAVSSPTVTNCSFIGNTAEFGGGMDISTGSPMVTNCSFSGNTAANDGGGMFNSSFSNPTVTNCSFTGNTAANDGGGMINNNSSPTVTNCSFSGNTALGATGISSGGGGMYNRGFSSPTVTNCSFVANKGDFNGGGMLNNEDSSPMVTNCSFSGNTAANDGGGMYNSSFSNPTVTNCSFVGNTAILDGGGMYNNVSSSPTMTNTGFCNNSPNAIFGSFTDGGGNSLFYCPPPIPVPPSCPADINTDTNVNVTDLLALLAAWGTCP